MAAKKAPAPKVTKATSSDIAEKRRLADIKALAGTGEITSLDLSSAQAYRNALDVKDLLTGDEVEMLERIETAGAVTFGTEFYVDNFTALKSLRENGLLYISSPSIGFVYKLSLTGVAKLVLQHSVAVDQLSKELVIVRQFKQ